ncbi:TIGR01841 family phasin [Paraburkholderia sp. MMS20-SJTR3]|uniref:TIGR01841 family phasin n=1 Tax=Paraburkholderia sejongensis TaxID=2886946 RepID=A0ABS8JQV7_9BURK|nr:TIGR01841 family phasin [Paraburkholderia sp. MMS20-SJTR3]MCC8392202.1 TIGR01841 family phasin [Paraburkholderia sp. MMS20-SJTR3]
MSVPMTEQFDRLHSGSVFTAFSLAQQAFKGFEELVRLNLHAAKQALPGSEDAQRLADKTPFDLWIEQANRVQPLTEALLEYHRQTSDISARTSAAILAIFDAGFEQQQEKLREVVEGFARNAPAGSEAAVSVMKSAVSFGSVGIDTIRKSAAQAIAMAQQGQAAVHSAG